MKTLATWNVNGLRACVKKGFLNWLNKSQHDIICLQETKLTLEQLPLELQAIENYQTWFASAEKKGYSGVALFSHKRIDSPQIKIGLDIEKFDREGRTIIAEYPKFILFCCYFPNGGRDLSRVDYKLEYSRAVATKALLLQKEKQKPIIVCGDINTAHRPIDLRNPKANEKNTGFLPIERAWIDEFIAQGFCDIFRQQHPDQPNLYTWWSYRADARQKNIGWRLDYFFVSNSLEKNVIKSAHCPQVMGSDHCPTIIELELKKSI